MKRLLVLLLALVLMVSWSLPALAAPTADVTITATPEYLAITNSEASWAMGPVEASKASTYFWTDDGLIFDEPMTAARMKSTITNTGSVTSDVNVKALNFTGGVGWTLAAVVGVNTVVLKVGGTAFANEAAMLVLLDGADQELKDSILAAGTYKWCMHLETGTFGDGVAKSCTVTLTIVKHV